MRVYLFGAGASATAGYPLGPDLLRALDTHLRGSRNVEHETWLTFVKWVENHLHLLPTVHLDSDGYLTGDVERLFTLADLQYGGILVESEQRRKIMFMLGDNHEQRLRSFTEFRDEYRDIEELMTKLYRGIWDYFKVMHWHDAKYDKLWQHMATWASKILSAEDIIITFNYDGLLERCLLAATQQENSQIKWSLRDGYGVNATFGLKEYFPLENIKSNVMLLKLHGSTGWMDYPGTPAIYIHPQFLHGFGIAGEWHLLSPLDDKRFYMIYPSYIKLFLNQNMRRIWQQSAEALLNTDEVIVSGYSFPQADASAEALILSSLGNNRGCKITVIDPTEHTRLQDILPDHSVMHHRQTLEEWVEQLVG